MSSLYAWADKVLPTTMKLAVANAKAEITHRTVRVKHRSRYANILHCCMQKTASRWLKRVLSHRLTTRYSGLRHAEIRGLKAARSEPLPPGSIIGPVYNIFPDEVDALPSTGPLVAFFVARDPRDLVVSWYHSMRYSHDATPSVRELREALEARSKEDGLRYAIDKHCEKFRIMKAWHEAIDPARVFVRYEDLTGPHAFEAFSGLFAQLDIAMPEAELGRLLALHSFERMAGRARGEEDRGAKLRKGIAGDWRNHFTPHTMAYFDSVADGLLCQLGYE